MDFIQSLRSHLVSSVIPFVELLNKSRMFSLVLHQIFCKMEYNWGYQFHILLCFYPNKWKIPLHSVSLKVPDTKNIFIASLWKNLERYVTLLHNVKPKSLYFLMLIYIRRFSWLINEIFRIMRFEHFDEFFWRFLILAFSSTPFVLCEQLYNLFISINEVKGNNRCYFLSP